MQLPMAIQKTERTETSQIAVPGWQQQKGGFSVTIKKDM